MWEFVAILAGIAFISFIPVLLWGYLFAYIDDTPVWNTRFLAGVFGWILAVIPVLYIDQIAKLTWLDYLNSFSLLSNISSIVSSASFGASLVLWVLCIALFSLLSVTVFHGWLSVSRVYLKNIFIFVLFIAGISFLFYLIHLLFQAFPVFDVQTNSTIGWVVNSSLKFIIFYYIVVWVIEESAKHFNFLQSSLAAINNYKVWVLYAIFVALGFSFTENMLYLYSEYSHSWFGKDFLKIYFFRSIFSVIVHVLASSLIGYYFSKAYLNHRKNKLIFPYIKVFLLWIFWWVILHSLFDIWLTLWFSLIIILYFLWGYFYVTSLLYRE